MKKLLIVDGSNLLFQMFFGMPARITGKDGRAIQGVLGFVGALLRIIRMTSPTHVAVLFDCETENERRELDPEYKANRPDYSELSDDESPFSQLPYVYSALDELKLAYAEVTGCETDDIIAAYAASFDGEVVISSFDSDFFQLITERVSVLRYRGDSTVICTPDYVHSKFGIQPRQYADFKAMVGDSADNIKGARGIGPKTAAALLIRFDSLEGVLENANYIKRPAIRRAVTECGERLRLSYRLIKLGTAAQLPFTDAEMEYSLGTRSTKEVLQAINIW